MKTDCLHHSNCLPKQKEPKNCAKRPDIFSHMRLIEGEEWKNTNFASKDARLRAVLIVTKTEPEPFEEFYIRRWDHPYEPNFETRTYNLFEFCQQEKVKKFFETGMAGNLIVWTKNEKTKELYFIGAFKGIEKLRKIEGYDRGKWKPRMALMATEAYVVPYDKGIPTRDFESEFRKRDLAFPSKRRTSSYQSCYGRSYTIDEELTKSIMTEIQANAVESDVYGSLAEHHTDDMLRKQEEIMEMNRKRGRRVNADRFRKRFITKQEIRYAERMGIL